METLQNLFFFPLITAFIVTAVVSYFSIGILKKMGIVDNPSRKHPGIIHKKVIPRGGGIALFAGIAVAAFIFLPLNNIVLAILAASLLSLIVGVIDDKYDVSPYIRFIANFVCAWIVVSAGVSIPYITNPLGGILILEEIGWEFNLLGFNFLFLLSDIVAMLWIVWIMNMLNWSKGVDGQMPGIVAISAFIIGILSLRFPVIDSLNIISAELSFIITGSALGFLLFNFHPAKIFPGYGATSIYLLLSVISMLSSAKLATAILVMGVPLADGAFTIIRRLLSGKSPFWHDKKHFHHLLLDYGFSQRSIALFYWVISAILGSLALVLSSRGKLFAIIMLIVALGGVLVFLNRFLKNKNENGS